MKSMILILSVLMLAAVALTACGGASSVPTQGQPRIFFYEDSVDLGTVPPGVTAHYTFHFRNVGDAPLVIEDVSAKALEGC